MLERRGTAIPVTRPSTKEPVSTGTYKEIPAIVKSPTYAAFLKIHSNTNPINVAGSEKNKACTISSTTRELLRKPRVRSMANSYVRSSTSFKRIE